SGRLVVVDGDFRDPRYHRSTARTENARREIPERKESKDQRSLDSNQLGLPADRLPQETGIPSGASRLAEIRGAASKRYGRAFAKRHGSGAFQNLAVVTGAYFPLVFWSAAALFTRRPLSDLSLV